MLTRKPSRKSTRSSKTTTSRKTTRGRKTTPTRKAAKRSTLTVKKARVAARAAKKRYANKRAHSASWKRGGREWSKVLGHFGLSPNDER
jgi:hypothetical protein